MARHVVTIASVSVWLLGCAFDAGAQTPLRPGIASQPASAREGSVYGLVRDDAGRAIAGASVMAIGSAPLPILARSDAAGQFRLALEPGEYILRATREGYVSTYREPVRIQSRTSLERTIVLVRPGVAPERRVVLAASAGVPDLDPEADDPVEASTVPAEPAHAHNETAWRLRHLPPSALRNIAGSPDGLEPGTNASFKPHPSFVDWMMGESARAAVSFFTNTNFTGQVNFLTSSSLAAAGSWIPAELPHGIAYLAIGAPVGSAGDWSLRGAMTATALASWVVLGEYTAREDQTHALRAGASYSSQPVVAGSELAPASLGDRAVRSVGGIYGFDRWRVRPGVELEYGVRLDRYDYVQASEFLSPRLGLRVRVLPTTHVTFRASDRSVAPGANEFLPPPSAGPWLPPERTFAPLLPDTALRAERVRNVAFGVDQQLSSSSDAPVVGVRRYRESAQDQVATLFGLDAESDVGHYYVATPGNVTAEGWVVRVTGRLTPRIKGSVQYTMSQAEWTASADAIQVVMLVPSVVRAAQERLHDLTTSLNASIPETSTKVAIAYRMNTAFSPDSALAAPGPAGRFDVEVRQALPLRLTRASRTELVIVVRNLFRDPGDAGSLYDELLTVAPPMRIMGGVQVKF